MLIRCCLLVGWALCSASITFGQSDTMTVTSRGMGVSPADAKKDALVNAMQQAVGSFLDSETLIENDQIIKDKVLSVSDGFVKSYDVIAGPTGKPNGLVEITIKAVVQKGKVIERLQEARVMKGNVSGKDAAAEVITKIENVEQGRQLLAKNLDGLLEKLLVARLVGADGKPSASVRPSTEIQSDLSLMCTWNIEIYFDMDAFYNQVVPHLDKVFRAVAEKTGGTMVCDGERVRTTELTGYPILEAKRWSGDIPPSSQRDSKSFQIAISIGRDKYGENERFRWYQFNRNLYAGVIEQMQSKALKLQLRFSAMESGGGVLREEVIAIRESRTLEPEFFSTSSGGAYAIMIAPRFHLLYNTRSRGYSDTRLIRYTVKIENDDLEKISQVRFRFTQ